jgi:hypothetical protein
MWNGIKMNVFSSWRKFMRSCMQLYTFIWSPKQWDLCFLPCCMTSGNSRSKLCKFNWNPLTESLHSTLHKIYTFLEAQQDGNRIKHLFRNNEMQTLLKSCHAGLKEAMDIFGVCSMFAFSSRSDPYAIRWLSGQQWLTTLTRWRRRPRSCMKNYLNWFIHFPIPVQVQMTHR